MPLKTTDWEKGTHVGGYSVVIDVRTPNEWQVSHGGGPARGTAPCLRLTDRNICMLACLGPCAVDGRTTTFLVQSTCRCSTTTNDTRSIP